VRRWFPHSQWQGALPAALLGQILTRTDGVPLFVEELTKSILESGELKEADDHYDDPRVLRAEAADWTNGHEERPFQQRLPIAVAVWSLLAPYSSNCRTQV
jgi:hypothetical protein